MIPERTSRANPIHARRMVLGEIENSKISSVVLLRPFALFLLETSANKGTHSDRQRWSFNGCPPTDSSPMAKGVVITCDGDTWMAEGRKRQSSRIKGGGDVDDVDVDVEREISYMGINLERALEGKTVSIVSRRTCLLGGSGSGSRPGSNSPHASCVGFSSGPGCAFDADSRASSASRMKQSIGMAPVTSDNARVDKQEIKSANCRDNKNPSNRSFPPSGASSLGCGAPQLELRLCTCCPLRTTIEQSVH